MDTAIELLQHYIKKTELICDKLSENYDFTHSHSISATKDCHTIEVHKVDELDEVCGFFIASAKLHSQNITFKLDYGDIDYEFFYCIDIAGRKYSFTAYLEAISGSNYTYPSSIRSFAKIDKYMDELLHILQETLPLFLSNQKKYIKRMTKITRAERRHERTELRRQNANAAIRKANIHFVEQEYNLAYKIYKKNRKHLTQPDRIKMDYSKDNKKVKA